jgi:hypothetical protein
MALLLSIGYPSVPVRGGRRQETGGSRQEGRELELLSKTLIFKKGAL